MGSSFGFSVYEGIDTTSNRSAVKLNNLWTEFQIEHNFSAAESFMSNDNNPIYSGTLYFLCETTARTFSDTLFLAFSDEMNEFVEQNNNLYPPNFLSTEEKLDIGKGYSLWLYFSFISLLKAVSFARTLYQGYCPMHVLDNTTFEHSKFLKWAQIFYGLTFVFMCLAVLHFYDVHPRIGPLAISIARMMKETRDSLTLFKLMLAVCESRYRIYPCFYSFLVYFSFHMEW